SRHGAGNTEIHHFSCCPLSTNLLQAAGSQGQRLEEVLRTLDAPVVAATISHRGSKKEPSML
ncbi:MAG: hypothetical protein II020_09390, partial [Lachnospiraceae bacterium]|nr:hypothetical protein [Lachnospiraceae bacterium]